MSAVGNAYSSNQERNESPSITALVIVSEDEEFRHALLEELDNEEAYTSCQDAACNQPSMDESRTEVLMLDFLVNENTKCRASNRSEENGNNLNGQNGHKNPIKMNRTNPMGCDSVGELVETFIHNWKLFDKSNFQKSTEPNRISISSMDTNGLVRDLGFLKLDHRSQRAYWMGNRVNLTATEFALVDLLASRSGTDIPYRDLYDLVHGKDFVAGHGSKGFRVNVRAMVKRIRQKFRAIDPDFSQIKNSICVGYRWSGPNKTTTDCAT